SHVEHPIDFIEDEDVDVAKIERALLHEVEQSARGGDHNVHAPSGFLSLFAITDAAVHYRNTKIGEPAIIAKSGFDLGRKLTRRLEDEAAEIPAPGEQGKNWKGEGRGLAGAGLRGADQVFPGENNRESAELDRRGFGEAHRLRAAHNFRRKAKIFK